MTNHWIRRFKFLLLFLFPLYLLLMVGCRSPKEYRIEADNVAYNVITSSQNEALGRIEPFSIERPSTILRRRLLENQNLHTSGPWSYGSDKLDKIDFWPEDDYPPQTDLDPTVILEQAKPVKLTLFEALQIGAQNSFTYQSQKESVFRAALALDLERNEFRHIFGQRLQSRLVRDMQGQETTTATQSSDTSWSKVMENGAAFSASLAVDIINLLTQGTTSTYGLIGDASVSVPLLRGSGRHIIREPLTQAERDVLYQIWTFERYKRTFAVDIATEYLAVLRQLDQVNNAEANYRRNVLSSRTSRRLADAGELKEIEVDQAVQSELDARQGWITAKQGYERQLDDFKNLLGLPVDANIELDRGELDRLAQYASKNLINLEESTYDPNNAVPADAPIVLVEPSMERAGPYEIDRDLAIRLAFEHRLDLHVAQGEVYDAQREVVIRADALGAELTLFGGVNTSSTDEVDLSLNEGEYTTLLTLNLPVERTAERNAYRNSLISLEQTIRTVQTLEDRIKLDVRNRLRNLLSLRESLQINALAVQVAEKRVRSVGMFFLAGDAQTRDLLEAQDALLRAQNSLTAAVVSYRVAELELQRDIGLLQVNEKGLWQEFNPKEYKDG
ncbi:MAG: TolC family protein [Sedimentisphaerales bacterium]|nr:TolC family protein [Sedimentisphaerales bacterium]